MCASVGQCLGQSDETPAYPAPYDAWAVEQRLENLDDDAVRETQEARAIRARRDARLSPEERLERTAELCRQLALIRPADQS